MVVGKRWQAIEAYVNDFDFSYIDRVKREIIQLYEADLRKLDSSSMIFSMYHCIPAQLSRKRFNLASATEKRKSDKSLDFSMNSSIPKQYFPVIRFPILR